MYATLATLRSLPLPTHHPTLPLQYPPRATLPCAALLYEKGDHRPLAQRHVRRQSLLSVLLPERRTLENGGTVYSRGKVHMPARVSNFLARLRLVSSGGVGSGQWAEWAA